MQNDIVKRPPLQPEMRAQSTPVTPRAPAPVVVAPPSDGPASNPIQAVEPPPGEPLAAPPSPVEGSKESVPATDTLSEQVLEPSLHTGPEVQMPRPKSNSPVAAVIFAVVICLCLVGLALYAGMQAN